MASVGGDVAADDWDDFGIGALGSRLKPGIVPQASRLGIECAGLRLLEPLLRAIDFTAK
jgi:hypothetical protein